MDKKKAPGIITDSIMLIGLDFKRYPVKPVNMKTHLNISYNATYNNETVAQGVMDAKIEGFCMENDERKEIFVAEMSFIGVFRKDEESPNMELESFIHNQAPGHIFPYVRELITNLSTRTGIPPIILPPVNLAAVLKLNLDAEYTDKSSSVDLIQSEE